MGEGLKYTESGARKNKHKKMEKNHLYRQNELKNAKQSTGAATRQANRTKSLLAEKHVEILKISRN